MRLRFVASPAGIILLRFVPHPGVFGSPNWEARGLLRAIRLPGSGFRRFASEDVERLRGEMFDQLAPATEGPVVNLGRKRSGRLVFGDATE